MRRGQAEFAVVLGLILVAVLIVYYAYLWGQGSPVSVPQSVQELQNTVRDSVTNLIRKGADSVIRDVEMHGGYLTPPSYMPLRLLGNDTYYVIEPYAFFLSQGAAYWQQCQNDVSPTLQEIEYWLGTGLGSYLSSHIDEVTDVFGKRVTFNLTELRVNAVVLDDRIKFDVHLPSTVRGYATGPSYSLRKPSELKRIYEFAKDFVRENSRSGAEQRFFEIYTIASIYFSRVLPTLGVMTFCGDSIHVTNEQSMSAMHELIIYTLTHTMWWVPMVNLPTTKVWGIEYVQERQYPDLNIRLFVPDNFLMTSVGSGMDIVNNQLVLTSDEFNEPECVATYFKTYSIAYPIIITVNDTLTGYSFNFADLVYIQDLLPADCDPLGPEDFDDFNNDVLGSGGQCGLGPDKLYSCTNLTPIQTCQNLNCTASISVEGQYGSPVQGAAVYFDNCEIGTTGADGSVVGPVKCWAEHNIPGADVMQIYGRLSIYKSGYEFFSQLITVPFLLNGTYTINKVKDVTFHFRTVNLSDCSASITHNALMLSGTSGSSVFAVNNLDYDINATISCRQTPECQQCFSTPPMHAGNLGACQACAALCSRATLSFRENVTTSIVEGKYNVESELLNMSNVVVLTGSTNLIGGFKLNYSFAGAWEEFYVYTPLGNVSLANISATYIDAWKEGLTSEMISRCGINPIESIEVL